MQLSLSSIDVNGHQIYVHTVKFASSLMVNVSPEGRLKLSHLSLTVPTPYVG
jgi:hypothetical protein